jgi:UDP-N-acetylmuramoyl-tripeptide--D-alanyl-D-alanine ligase
VGVINVDHPLLRAIADQEAHRIRVVRCSTRNRASDVFVDPESGRVEVAGHRIGTVPVEAVHPGNVACAVGIVVALGLEAAAVGERLADVPVAPNRQTMTRSRAGFVIIDDTFNSNPAGARAALDRLAATTASRKVLVTPGMVELGYRQSQENRAMAGYAAGIVSDLVVVGRTNRSALRAGAADAGLTAVIVTGTREQAVDWVRSHLGPEDAVLYENDLPDHYP